MKKNAIVRIVIFSLVIIALLGILLAGIGFQSLISKRVSRSSERWETVNSDVTHTGVGTGSSGTASSGIRELKIEWVSGTITILPGDVENITYQESDVSDSKYRMITKESGDSLKIQFCKENLTYSFFSFFGTTIEFSKDLVITVPRTMTLDSIEIESAATALIIQDMTIRDVDLDTASGACTFTNCSVDTLDVDSASGRITFSGILGYLDLDAASADFEGVLFNTPTSIAIDTVSGDLDITLPSDSGFTVEIDALSSDFTSEFQTTTQNGVIICGNGACRIDVDGVSGDVIIRKAQ